MVWKYSEELGMWTGLSSVAKPLNIERDTVAFEYDTGNKYVFDGSNWVMVKRGFDGQEDMFKVKSMQKKFRDSFSGVAVDATKWDTVIGAGGTVSVAAGALTMGSGTTIASETYLQSVDVFTIPFRVGIGLALSQRIVNQTFLVEAISVDPVTFVPDGIHCAALMFDGTTVTQGKYRVQNGALTPLDSAAVTLPTTAAAGVYEIEPFADECWFHGGTLDSTSARANSYRRHQQIPDPNAVYKMRLRWLNGGSAPATNTNAVVQYIAVQDYAELTAEITAGRGNAVAGQGIYATVAGSVTATGVAGAAAHDAVISGNPLRIGARGVTANYTGVASGDVADLIATLVGVLIQKPYSIPEGDWSFACAAPIAVNTDTVMKAAGAAGIRNYCTALQYHNTNAVATEVVVKDSATVIWRGYAPANMVQPAVVILPDPLRGTAATVMNFTCITAGAAVYANAQGYQAP
jgi:hypothetical protein